MLKLGETAKRVWKMIAKALAAVMALSATAGVGFIFAGPSPEESSSDLMSVTIDVIIQQQRLQQELLAQYINENTALKAQVQALFDVLASLGESDEEIMNRLSEIEADLKPLKKLSSILTDEEE